MSESKKNNFSPAMDQNVGKFLIVDDETMMLNVWKVALQRNGHEVIVFDNPVDALSFLAEQQVDVAILDYAMPEMTGIELLKVIKERWPSTEVIMMTGYASIETALEAMKSGAYDYLQKPFEQIKVALHVAEKALERKQLRDRNRELEAKLERLEQFDSYEGMIGTSPKMREVFQLIEQVAKFDASVLIEGDTGTGKEKVARAIHAKSPRHDKPFIPVVCSAIPENLIESTLFGYKKGAFTGATRDSIGLIQAADKGTLFLDEVGDIPLAIQIKLLRVLQEGEFQRVGDVHPTSVDIRVISATHRDLRTMIQEGHFREDLYYRLNLIEIHLPPLKERPEDIPALAYYFLEQHGQKYQKKIKSIAPEVIQALQQFSWPGNVRQLEHLIARALILEQSDTLSLESLPPEFREKRSSDNPAHLPFIPAHLTFKEAKKRFVSAFEQRYLRNLLANHDFNISKAAITAGMDRANLRRLLIKNNLLSFIKEQKQKLKKQSE